MVQSLPPSADLKPGQIRIFVETLEDSKEEALRLAKLALRTRMFRFDDRDDVQVERADRQGVFRFSIVANHDSLKPKPSQEENT